TARPPEPHSKPQPAQCPQQKAAEYAPARWRRFVATFPLTAEIGVVSLALKELTRCDKIRDRRQAWCRLQAAGAATTPGRAWGLPCCLLFLPREARRGPRVSTVEGASA